MRKITSSEALRTVNLGLRMLHSCLIEPMTVPGGDDTSRLYEREAKKGKLRKLAKVYPSLRIISSLSLAFVVG